VTNPEMGVKRVCLGCNGKFYDLAKNPIICPKCGATFVPVLLARAPPRRMGRPFSSTSRPFEDQGAATDETEVEVIGSAEEADEDGEEKPAIVENEA